MHISKSVVSSSIMNSMQTPPNLLLPIIQIQLRWSQHRFFPVFPAILLHSPFLRLQYLNVPMYGFTIIAKVSDFSLSCGHKPYQGDEFTDKFCPVDRVKEIIPTSMVKMNGR
jgi:hypothetical protein